MAVSQTASSVIQFSMIYWRSEAVKDLQVLLCILRLQKQQKMYVLLYVHLGG